MESPLFEGHVLLELMGHRQLAGFAREIDYLGTRQLRVDICLPEGEAPQYSIYPAHAIFATTPINEELARESAESNLQVLRQMGVRPWPKAPAFGTGHASYHDDDDEDSDEQDWEEDDRIF